MSQTNNHLSQEDLKDYQLVKDQVIVGNNAKSIYDHLVSLRNEPRHRLRWIWELMQNAQDSNANDITVSYDGNEVVFTHNGEQFSKEDVTHVIFHGSSKPEDKTGKFGTGFMTTHLLSNKVRIQGNLENERYFDFELNRTGLDPYQMKDSLDTSWSNFTGSIRKGDIFKENIFTYIELYEEGHLAVENVMTHIHEYLPAVLAFSKINSVQVKYKMDKWIFRKGSSEKNDSATINRFTDDGIVDYSQSFLITELEACKGQIAIPIDAEGALAVLKPEIPRLFITFPLIGTAEAFPLPFLINSSSFRPSPEREKLWLSSKSSTQEVKENKAIIQQAFKTYVTQARKIADDLRANLHLLANLGCFPKIEWIDSEWYKELMLETFMELDQIPILDTFLNNSNPIPLELAKIPAPEAAPKDGELTAVWKLCRHWCPQQIPQEMLNNYWVNVLADRSTFFPEGKHPSSFTIKDICQAVNQIKGHQLAFLPCVDMEPIDFMKEVISILEKLSLQSYWNEFSLLPVQSEELCQASFVKQELLGHPQEIGDDLKEIADYFDIPLRKILLHKAVTITSENFKLPEYKREVVVATLLQNAKNKSLDQLSIKQEKGIIKFFEWLVKFGQGDDLAAFPVKMRSGIWVKMQKGNEPFLSPVLIWQKRFQKYVELFPEDYILNDCYEPVLVDSANRDKLEHNRWVLNNPLYYENAVFDDEEIRSMVTRRMDRTALAKPENAEWKMNEKILMSKIAYFNTPENKNVLNTARSAVKRSRELLEFIIDVLLHVDHQGFSRHELVVSSESEKRLIGIYPSKWLNDIKRRAWVREIGNKVNNRPSVEALLNYFKQSEENEYLYNSLLNANVSRFLNFLGVGVGELLRNIRSETEEEGMGWDQSYAVILMNKNLTPQKVTTLLGDPNFVASYEQRKQEDEWRKQNQKIGTDVEEAFDAAFANLSGFRIRREPIGSDYVIECDFPHRLLIEGNEKKFIIEIKSSRSKDVKMTIRQGQEAYKNPTNYLLCVVPIEGDINPEMVIKNARFVINIAALISSRVERVAQITSSQLKAVMPEEGDTPDITTAVEGTNIRYVIGERIWQQEEPKVLTFDQFIQGLLKRNDSGVIPESSYQLTQNDKTITLD